MLCSEARLNANRQNALKSSGPRTPEGKERSRQNGLKHGLTGKGIVSPEGDSEEIASRVEALQADMKPRSPSGVVLILQMATLSVRAERAVAQETAQLSMRVRHAADDFDEERIELANDLFEGLGDDPRNLLRKLKKTPEGVDRLLDAWRDLRADLTIDPEPVWTASHLERAAHLTGLKTPHARGSRLGALSRGLWGDFAALGDGDGGSLDDEDRRAWSKARLLERIDAEIAGLETHYETLDFEMIQLDRAEAGSRALFDPSKEACLARRYETEARRGFYKALKEFRQVEAESEANAEMAPAPPAPPATARPQTTMGSSWETPPPPAREPARTPMDRPSPSFATLCGHDGQPLRVTPPAQKPG